MYSGGREDSPAIQDKADAVQHAEGSRPECVKGKYSGYHRGLRPGHVSKGVARELGRAKWLLVVIVRKRRGTGRSRALAFNGLLPAMNESRGKRETQRKGAHKVSGEESEERTNPRWAFGSLS